MRNYIRIDFLSFSDTIIEYLVVRDNGLATARKRVERGGGFIICLVLPILHVTSPSRLNSLAKY